MSDEVIFEVGDHMIKKSCAICNKKFIIGEKCVLVPLQKPRGDYFINSVAIPVHHKCRWVTKDE